MSLTGNISQHEDSTNINGKEEVVTEKQQKKDASRKRIRDSQQARYDGIKFSPRAASGRPASPHRFFSSSYDVSIDADEAHHTECQVIHRHANGLAIITAGSLVKDFLQKSQSQSGQNMEIKDFTYTQDISTSQSVGGKRKKARKMKGGGKSSGVVNPTDTLAVVTFSNDTTLHLKCCVAGTLLELNTKLVAKEGDSQAKTLSLLSDNALLDGYLAVVMPTGFPSTA